ncbi:HugZ family heme oxygenase [Helicobacter sp. MIT 14-3879]|uniref:HugZ family heme oxygenase n=1 Tax=Helicobacter sp. MIT 14-3879 TaxID=2040649 RepID=UPI000E1F0ED7|nr:HugZ family heme oxygenase [Helicobacter sp. MIT 14-3879]RDU65127.1 HugZ family heme oxygenase [Helicobacter sp. MIT 14-3879]
MSIDNIITHMNNHHRNNLIDLCRKFGGVSKVDEVELIGVDFNGLDIVYDGHNLHIDFPKKATQETLKDAVIELCMSVKQTHNIAMVKEELETFIKGFASISMATISSDNKVMCSYAPLIQTEWGNYIYISEVSEHYENIKNNPKNIEIMFIEDESKASSIILRKRARFRSEASFISRGEEFDKIFDEFELQHKESSGIKTIRKMQDFHLIKLDFKNGRFVKGFGQAYDIINGEINFAGNSGNPHKMPHK